MNVKLIRMSSGEDLVLDLIEENQTTLVVENVIVAIPTGNGQLGFAPWSPILSREVKHLEINKNFVVYITHPEESVVEQYEKMFSPISKPPSKKLIL